MRAVRRHTPLVWSVLALLATAGHVVLVVRGPHLPPPFDVVLSDALAAPIGLASAVVGAVLARRLPEHPVGWLLGAFGTLFALGRFGEVYAAQGLVAGATRPGMAVVNWFGAYEWAFALLALAMALLHFPTGTLPSRRWRPLRAATVVLALALLVVWLLLWPVRSDPSLLVDTSAFPPLANALAPVVEWPVLLVTVTAVVSVVLRRRTADAVGRLQLRWLFAATLLVFLGVALMVVTGSSPDDGDVVLVPAVMGLGLLAVPVSIAVAVLRYRLYEIDRLLNRTAAWTIVSAILAGTYFAAVVLLQSVLRPVVGEGDLPVALATLAAAAVARPLLRRVQRVVDRRFNRAHYDATRTVDGFARGLRDEVSRDAVVADLRRVAIQTFSPETVGVVLVERAT